MFNPSPEESETILNDYRSRLSAASIAKKHKVPPPTMIRWLKKQPSAKWRGHAVYDVDDGYFANIDTPGKAYTLGFICADGSVCTETTPDRRKSLRIMLAAKDREILEYIRQELRYSGPIKTKVKGHARNREYVSLHVTNTRIVDDLKALGLHSRKTYGFDLNADLKGPLLWHFVRGFFDGDGCLHLGRGKNGRLITALSFVVCNGFGAYLSSALTKAGIGHRINALSNTVVVRQLRVCARKDVLKLCQFLYGEGFRLERKHAKYLELLRLLTTEPPPCTYRTRPKSSRYYGVSYCNTTSRWRGVIRKDKKDYRTGLHKSEKEAALAVNRLVSRLYLDPFDIESRLNKISTTD